MSLEHVKSYINRVLSSLITIFPLVNPIWTAFILNPFFSGLLKSEQREIAQKIALYFYLCLATLLLGQYILEVFSLSVPVVQFAGGIIIYKIVGNLAVTMNKITK